MRYAGLIKNDFVNGEGVCVSFWAQGCPHKCLGCHNPETWDFNAGMIVPNDIKGQIIKAISENGITRNFSVLGGEPLCAENIQLTCDIVTAVRAAYPEIKIYLWTGYDFHAIPSGDELDKIILKIDCLITGPYIEELRDVTLPLIGSSNQKVIYLT